MYVNTDVYRGDQTERESPLGSRDSTAIRIHDMLQALPGGDLIELARSCADRMMQKMQMTVFKTCFSSETAFHTMPARENNGRVLVCSHEAVKIC